MATEHDELGGPYSAGSGNSSPDVKANLNSLEAANADTGSTATRKKRRKPIKSCTFCRKRKLRCDQQKPMCSTCIIRELPDCIYLGESPTLQGGTNFCGKGPNNAKLLHKVNELERQLKDVASKVNGTSGSVESTAGGKTCSISTVPLTPRSSTKNINPFRNLFHLQSKENGRRILYGPTSFRALLFWNGLDLTNRFQQLKERVKIARNEMKKEYGISMLRENSLLEQPHDIGGSDGMSNSSLLKQIACVLPTYEQVAKILDLFFSKPDLYEVSEAFDRSKVLADFRWGFIPGVPDSCTGERPIVNILPHSKLNYYKAGVILGIVSLVHFGNVLPFAVEKFFVFLSGLSTGKMMYTEKVQFSLLRYLYRDKWGQGGGDNTHMIALVDSMVGDSISIGLNRDIRQLVRGQADLVGSVRSLENLFCWVLLSDFTIAFFIGRPLKLNDDNIFQDDFFDDESSGFYGLLKRSLKMVRSIMNSIFDKAVYPDLDKHSDDILTFIEDQFFPISFYTDASLIHKTPFQETRVLCLLLTMFLALNGLKIISSSPTMRHAKVYVLKISLMSLSLVTNFLSRCLELDKQAFPEALRSDYKLASPYVLSGMSMGFELLKGSMVMSHALAYQKFTIFESTFLTFNSEDDKFDWDFSTFRIPQKNVPAIGTLSMFHDAFDRLKNPSDSQLGILQKRCPTFKILISIERVLRTVVDKVLECRTNTESLWKTQLSRQNGESQEKCFSPPTFNMENEGLSLLGNFEENSHSKKSSALTTSTSAANPSSSPAEANSNVISLGRKPSSASPRTRTPVGARPPDLPASGQETDLLGMISDDFLVNYNTIWTELLDNAESGELFPDMNF